MIRSTFKHGSDDTGVAMLTVLGVVAIITVLAVGSYAIASQTLHEARLVEGESQAFRVAETGLDRALVGFSETSVYDGTFPIVGATNEGTYTVTVETGDSSPELGYGEYRLVSTGVGRDGSTERVTQQFFFMNLWKMNFAGTGDQTLISGSGGLNGTSNIVGPFYMKGNLSIASNMSVLEGPLFVKGGNISVSSSGMLGSQSQYIKVFCDGTVPPNGAKGGAGGVFVSQVSRSVPDIKLPQITQDDLEAWASKARQESVDNILGTPDREPQRANLEAAAADPSTYQVIDPPNSGTWSRSYADTRIDRNPCYKFVGRADGTIASKGDGTFGLTIGGRSFGSWGSVVTTDGVNLPGDGHYTLANSYDDFAYDDVNNRLYIGGTVFVDGPVTFAEDMTYIGNGTIVANGPITINGELRPYGTNTQGENNGWALGLVTPKNIVVNAQASNSYGTFTARDDIPTLAGAFYAEGVVTFNHNVLMRGSVIAGRIDSQHPNMCLVTNPLLPQYLPASLPGVDMGLLMPGLWSRR